ncbi:hypothetical protein LUW76_36380 [Actinomadura madurae]|nr:hypothetical protein [Actinomadura madurae]URM99372.1 hypothetical protein LUW76_36380 [Actinomadura madurae]
MGGSPFSGLAPATASGGAQVAGAPHRAVEEPDGRRDDAEDLAAGVLSGAVEQPGEERGRAAHAEPAALLAAERVPFGLGEQVLDERQRKFLLVFAVRAEPVGEAFGLDGQPCRVPRPDGRVDGGEQAVEALVLGLHPVQDGRVRGLGPQDGPQVGVLGGVVDVQKLREPVPAGLDGRSGGVPGVRHGGEAAEVALERVVDGVHEGHVDAVALFAHFRSFVPVLCRDQ